MRRPRDDSLIVAVAPESPPWLATMLARERVSIDDVAVVSIAPLARRASTALAFRRADRLIVNRFRVRNLADRLAARRVVDGVETIYAASLAARRTFAAARRQHPGTRCVLVEDLPDLRQLHDDLDRAAAAHPELRFLNRYRATREMTTRQIAERVLADSILVRSEFARACRIAAGIDPANVELLDAPVVVAPRRRIEAASPTVLLAGLAAARNGLAEALQLVDAVPTITLAIRAGEGLEPADALARRRVRQATTLETSQLDGIDLVVAPAWCEGVLPEVALAAALGVPVIATDRVAGRVDLERAGALIDPGDVDGLIAAAKALFA